MSLWWHKKSIEEKSFKLRGNKYNIELSSELLSWNNPAESKEDTDNAFPIFPGKSFNVSINIIHHTAILILVS